MAFKQPRVPEFQENEGVSRYLKVLTLFLKDFCQDAWVASRNVDKKLSGIHYPVISVNGKTGEVTLNASDVDALKKDAAAADSSKLGGIAADQYAKKTDIPQDDPLKAWPVGRLYFSADSISPASLFGGTWELLKDRFLIGAGGSYALGSTGGEAAHTLTENEMPSHNHSIAYERTSSGGVDFRLYKSRVTTYAEDKMYYSTSTMEAGGSKAHNNMPPYLAVCIWKRVA